MRGRHLDPGACCQPLREWHHQNKQVASFSETEFLLNTFGQLFCLNWQWEQIVVRVKGLQHVACISENHSVHHSSCLNWWFKPALPTTQLFSVVSVFLGIWTIFFPTYIKSYFFFIHSKLHMDRTENNRPLLVETKHNFYNKESQLLELIMINVMIWQL